jgi:F0F1-type ATP synthase epsilon subunit
MSDAAVDKKALGDAVEKTKDEKLQEKAVQDYSKIEDNGELSMLVKIHSPFHEYYNGQAFSISAENATGPFDILPRHHHFISLLNSCILVIRTVNKGEQRIRIGGGLMHVKSDSVTVFLDV